MCQVLCTKDTVINKIVTCFCKRETNQLHSVQISYGLSSRALLKLLEAQTSNYNWNYYYGSAINAHNRQEGPDQDANVSLNLTKL